MQGVLQGFRVVGSGSKLGRDYPVVAYRFGGAVELEKLLDYIPASNGERQHLQALMKRAGYLWLRPKRSIQTGMSAGL